jgi:hypothetical protein
MRLTVADNDPDILSLRFDLLAKSVGGCPLQVYRGVDYDIQLKCDGRLQAQRRVDGSSRSGHILHISKLQDGDHSFQTRVRAVNDVKWSSWGRPLTVTVHGEDKVSELDGWEHGESGAGLSREDSFETSASSIGGLPGATCGPVFLDADVLDNGEQSSHVAVQVCRALGLDIVSSLHQQYKLTYGSLAQKYSRSQVNQINQGYLPREDSWPSVGDGSSETWPNEQFNVKVHSPRHSAARSLEGGKGTRQVRLTARDSDATG